ncbi:MAG: hypothetical protein JWM64_341 [Frankiales bacterium]|nr:hypothetical protein [Frankiales bacterium]
MTQPPDEQADQQQAQEQQADALAARLFDAHRRLRTADLSADDKGRAARRLIALTDASKHDVGRAAARLDAFLADLDAGRVAAD